MGETDERGVARLSFLLAEGPPYHRGASASKKDSLATPLEEVIRIET
jgi:hypothetical protein